MFDPIAQLFKRAKRIDQKQGLERQLAEIEAARELILAADDGRLEDLRAMLAEVPAGLCDEAGRTPLMYAARRGYIECVELLLEHGDPKAIEHNGQTALHWAASWGQIEACRLLLPVSDPDMPDYYSDTPLSLSVRHGDAELVGLLRDATRDCRHALMCAVAGHKTEIVKLLLERVDPTDCFSPRVEGGTPLRRAARDGYDDITELLLPRFGDADSAQLMRALNTARDEGSHKSADLISGRIAELQRAAIERDLEEHTRTGGMPAKDASQRRL